MRAAHVVSEKIEDAQHIARQLRADLDAAGLQHSDKDNAFPWIEWADGSTDLTFSVHPGIYQLQVQHDNAVVTVMSTPPQTFTVLGPNYHQIIFQADRYTDVRCDQPADMSVTRIA